MEEKIIEITNEIQKLPKKISKEKLQLLQQLHIHLEMYLVDNN